MNGYYNSDIIPVILKEFNVKNIVISGLSDNETVNQISSYCDVCDDVSCIEIDLNDNSKEEIINDFTLNVLPNLSNYDAIFLNDDPNWYTVYNELNIIKNNNLKFPLVFICHSVFPHKRRDSYIDPEVIPKDFLNEYCDTLICDDIVIHDDFFHAVKDNTSKNGVLTAIEDFMAENSSIGIMNIKFLNGMSVLYFKNFISENRIKRLFEEIEDKEIEYNFSDDIVRNKVLTNHISKFKLNDADSDIVGNFKSELDEKERVLNEFENKIRLNNQELSLKDSQISDMSSKLDFKETQLKISEFRLVNRDIEIDKLNNQLQNANDKIDNLENTLSNSKRDFEYKEREFKSKYVNQFSKLDSNTYSISCYKNEIENNKLEIEYYKKNGLARKLLSPLAYAYMILKSRPRELPVNFKLYRAMKSSKCFDIGFYLNNNKDISDSKWCRYFSPELHYICNGFDENRKFNKKYYNTNSKKELLDYLLNCN